jgi:hypothetical protein
MTVFKWIRFVVRPPLLACCCLALLVKQRGKG